MRKYAWVSAAVALLVLHAVLTPRTGTWEGLLRVADGARLSLAQAMPDLAGARLVFVGELHDQRSHHAAQIQVIRAFHEADRPVAVGLEMFRAENQHLLDRWVEGSLSLEEFLPIYYENWGMPWVYYRDIFLYAREHGIPLVGLNVPQHTIRQVARDGFESLTQEQLGELPEVRCEVDETYEDFIRRALGMHGHEGRAFRNFCEAQILWDTAMAVHVVGFLEDNPDHTVVVLAGSGHAWKRGIPDQVQRIAPFPMRIVVPEIPNRLDRAGVTADDADYLWVGLPLE
ncbi:MAG: ChaN family lipoprotein [Deferrisomatales bacterium]|nr:ChaN family lipoprotein [Deferrisomatales bacterium]